MMRVLCFVVFLVGMIFCASGWGENAETAILIVSPSIGDAWCAGSSHVIAWKSNGIPQNKVLKIEYSTDDGASWTGIADSVKNTGSYVWKLPGVVSKESRLRISSGGLVVPAGKEPRFEIMPSKEVSTYKWVHVTQNAAYTPRDGAGALVYKGKMWLLGGWNPENKTFFPKICNNEVWSSTDGAAWTLMKPNTFADGRFDPEKDWEGRHTAGYVVYKNKMWIIGGDANQHHYHLDVWNSEDGAAWSHVNRNAPVPWGPRVLDYVLVFKDKIWVMGGQTMPAFAPAEEHFYHDIWNTSDGVNWEKVNPVEPMWPERGMIGGNVVFRDEMWILGGGTYDTPAHPERLFYNDVWSSPDGVHWKCRLNHAPWAPRQYHDVAVFDGKMWVLEGWNKANRNDVWYSSDGLNWYELEKTPWNPRHAASVFVYKNALWMVAGNNMENDVWKLIRTSKKKNQN